MLILPEVAEAALQATMDIVVEGSISPRVVLIIYKGTAPGDLLVAANSADELARITFTLHDEYDMQAQADAVIATLNPELPQLATQSGVASFFRIFNRDNVALFEGSITDRAGNGDLKLPITNMVAGIYVRGVSLKLKVPTA
ncbi:hypothetical protein EVB87_281 [Rhizobium phage RHph_N28_1]|nr:hypothetical protein EVB87_281 [Rhizobium phage RHph_N28_1]QIG74309.1 hypothetical protein EVC07_281 [Rhizobium phage RHph_N42]